MSYWSENMQINLGEIYQKNLDKIAKASNDSHFNLCAHMSTDMLRVSDYLEFGDGVFMGEFLESLFQNLDFLKSKYVIEDEEFDSLKPDIFKLIQNIKSPFPYDDESKIKIFDLMKNIRAKTTKLQLESIRGEKKRINSKKLSLPPKLIAEIEDDFE